MSNKNFSAEVESSKNGDLVEVVDAVLVRDEVLATPEGQLALGADLQLPWKVGKV
jgi:hypothetical protein